MDLDELLALIYEVDKETSTVAIDIPRQKLERLWMEHVMERLVNDENAYEIGKSGFRGMNDRSDIMLFTDIKLNVPEDELRDVLGCQQ